jgi:tungstate transport system ATP-binding protein
MSIPAVKLQDIAVNLGSRIVLDIPSLEVARGEVLAIIGPNGAGKTILLLTLSLLITPSRGTIRIWGEEVDRRSNLVSLRRRMAAIFQEPLLLNTSVQENVETGLRFRGLPHDERKRRIGVWLERFGISHLANRQARALSGGEAQRVSLARAFALEPEILFLDEPFSALDAPTRDSLINDLRSVLLETGTTTVFVTHNREEALAMAQRVGVLIRGRLLQTGSPGEVFTSPVNKDVAGFVGMENIVAGEVARQKEGLAEIRLGTAVVEAVSDAPAGQKVYFCLRPEEVTITVPGGEALQTSARNWLVGKVSVITPSGSLVKVTVDCGFPLVSFITRRSAEELALTEGQLIQASFKATAIHLIRRS